ncbi:DDE-type integrase/transposase/recombinase [Psychrobacter lutiphocae]|uniref:DDE-type integrase/transposase/recombinase n=1 Tax=Psychrobacter lutiphocae TaxID=540500 RepID=UPI000367B8DF|nr:DDE-type integrase/transposase/recombinase [Psychrobacter lutiphocae]
MDTATYNYLKQLAQRLQSAKHGQKTPIVEQAAEYLCCSTKQVYQLLKDAGLTKPRKTRTDKGDSMITKAQAELIGGMILVATRANGKQILSVSDAAEMLKAQGKLPDVAVSTILRALKAHHCHPSQLSTPTAHVNQRSLHPNHVWQIDASVCVLFYLPKGGLAVMEQKEFYKNKPANIRKIEKQRVIRYVVTDHYSAATYVEYVMGAESSENLTQVFLNAIQKRAANDPMHGVPNILVMDKGSANLSGLFLNLLDRLQVEHIEHAAGNSRAKGQVEKHNDIVECKFESRLTFLNIKTLDELNAYCTKWRTHFNATATHSRTRKTRNAVWLTITPEQLRLAPSMEICRELVTTKPKVMKVRGDLTVTHTIKGYPNQTYDVTHLPDIYPKAEVEIVVNPYRAPDIDVTWLDTVYTISPIQTDEAGFAIHSPVIGETMITKPDSQADANRKAMLKDAYGVDTESDVDKARKKKQAAYQGKVDAMADVDNSHIDGNVPNVITKAGQTIDTSTHEHLIKGNRELKPLTHVQAAMELRGLLGNQWTPEHYQDLQQQYPNGVPQTAITDIADRIVMGKPVQHLKVVNH